MLLRQEPRMAHPLGGAVKIFLGVFFGILAAVIFLVFLISGWAYYDLRSQGYTPDSQGNYDFTKAVTK